MVVFIVGSTAKKVVLVVTMVVVAEVAVEVTLSLSMMPRLCPWLWPWPHSYYHGGDYHLGRPWPSRWLWLWPWTAFMDMAVVVGTAVEAVEFVAEIVLVNVFMAMEVAVAVTVDIVPRSWPRQ